MYLSKGYMKRAKTASQTHTHTHTRMCGVCVARRSVDFAQGFVLRVLAVPHTSGPCVVSMLPPTKLAEPGPRNRNRISEAISTLLMAETSMWRLASNRGARRRQRE